VSVPRHTIRNELISAFHLCFCMLNRTTLTARMMTSSSRTFMKASCIRRTGSEKQNKESTFCSIFAFKATCTTAARNLTAQTTGSAAKPKDMQTDALGNKYFPDVKLKNTPLGKAKRDKTFSSFNAILDYDQLSSSSKKRAQSGQLVSLSLSLSRSRSRALSLSRSRALSLSPFLSLSRSLSLTLSLSLFYSCIS
jgi:hypothetical protein